MIHRVLLLTILPPLVLAEPCLTDAECNLASGQPCVPPHLRLELSSSGRRVPLGIWVPDWPSARLVAAVYRIVAEEILGYNTTLGWGDATAFALRALAGCGNPLDTSSTDCNERNTIYHVTLELWSASLYPFGDPYKKPFLRELGGIGYNSRDGMAVLEALSLRFQDRHLEYYRSFQASKKPWTSFDQFTSYPQETLKTCNETRRTTPS